jgi:ABC-type enterochelin transport system permease subunit
VIAIIVMLYKVKILMLIIIDESRICIEVEACVKGRKKCRALGTPKQKEDNAILCCVTHLTSVSCKRFCEIDLKDLSTFMGWQVR